MLEKIGTKEVIVRDYTNNFSLKELIQEELIPKAFPGIEMNRLNLGFTGVVSEVISQAIEDSQSTASLMLNESFITKATLPSSIYNHASQFDIGYQFAVPSSCSFAIEIKIDDIVEYSTPISGTNSFRYVLDKNTKTIIGDYKYSLDYDIIIDHQVINGKRLFDIYYDMEEPNSISNITDKHIKHQVSNSGWLVLFTEMREYIRRMDTFDVVDNFQTTNVDISISWANQLAGIELVYISPLGERYPMKLKPKYSRPISEPFMFYSSDSDNSMKLIFSPSLGYWTPEFNSKIEYTLYVCNGKSANFTTYTRTDSIPVKKTGDRFEYNMDTLMAGFCLSASQGGLDKGSTETLRSQVLIAYNNSNAITTDRDLQLWFDYYGQRNNSIGKFFQRRNDPSGRLFAGFIAIKDDNGIYPTNTLQLHINENEFDYEIDNEIIIKAGHVWKYKEDSIDTVEMVHDVDNNPIIITTGDLPSTTDGEFLFVNPFLMKIYKNPLVCASYNSMLSTTSYLEEMQIQSKSFYQFQLAQFSIDRNIASDSLHLEVICIPVTTNNSEMNYVTRINDDSANATNSNNLRLVTIFRSKKKGETGYAELNPISYDEETNSIVFAIDIPIEDNMNDDMEIEIPTNVIRKSQLVDGKIYLDSYETSFHFLCLIKDPLITNGTTPFNDSSFTGYTICNRFANRNRELNLYEQMGMMRNMVSFSNDRSMDISLVPLMKYDIPLDDEKMKYFIQSFDAQYKAMSPILSRLEGNSFLDLKLYNTYGRPMNYYIGPDPEIPNLKDSQIRLNDLHIKIKLVISVYDRALYTQSVEEIKALLIKQFDGLGSGEVTDIYVSDIIKNITENVPNVRYVRFLGFNNEDVYKQAIFRKPEDTSLISQEYLQNKVLELIRFDSDSVEIFEET